MIETVQSSEMITDEQETHKILEHLDKISVSGYTVIRNILGKSPRATFTDELPITGLGNAFVLLV